MIGLRGLVLAALVTGGVVVPATAIEDAEGHNAVERLFEQADAAVADASYQMSTLPLTVEDAYGQAEAGEVERLVFMVKATRSIDLTEGVARMGAEGATWHITEVLRGGPEAASGRLERGDLVRIEVDIEPLQRGESARLLWDVPDARTAAWDIEVPSHVHSGLVELKVSVTPFI